MGADQNKDVECAQDSAIGTGITASRQDPNTGQIVSAGTLEDRTLLCSKMISNIGDVIVIIDANGINRYKSPNMEAIFGWKPDEVIGAAALANVHPEDVAAAETFILELLKVPNAINEIECRYKSKDGTYKWILFTGKNLINDPDICGILGNYHDVTARKQAEQKIAHITTLLNDAQRIANMGAWELDLVTGKTFWSDEVYAIHEVGKDFNHSLSSGIAFYHPDDQLIIAHAIEKSMAQQVPFDVECRFITAKGNHRWVRASGHPVVKDGKSTHLIGMFQDTTERKNAEEALLVAKEAAEAANRAKSQFLANMSHELRTPMNGVLGFADLLRYTNLDDTQKTYVSTILSSGKILLSVIQEILDFSKVEAGKVELEVIETDVYEMIRQTADLIGGLADSKGIAFHVAIDPAISRVAMLDPTRLRQILFNLLSNAVKFTEKGDISLNATLVQQSGSIQYIKFTVRDTGVGIPAEHRKNLFKAFSQGDNTNTRKYGGTGLGLVIADRLAQLMGGKIDFTSTPDVGSEFFFTIETECRRLVDCPVVDDVSENNLDKDV